MLSLVFIFVIPWEGVELPGLGAIAKLGGFVVGAFWVATVLLTGRFRKPGPFHIAVFLFVLWNGVTVFWSANPGETVGQVLTWAQLLIFVFILWDLNTTRTTLLAGLQAYVLGAYVALGSALSNYLAGSAFYTNYQRFSPGDTNPDGFGFILVLGMPVAWYLAASQSAIRTSNLLKLVNYAYIPAALLGIALSGTRTSLIATIPAMAFGLASLTRLRLAARIVVFLLLMSAVLILLPYVQTLESFQRLGTTGTELTEGDLNNRTNNWREGLASFAEHPLLGIGSNMYRSVNSLGKVAHNSYLSVLVELGLIGFALFAMILTIAFIQAWGQPKWDARFWLSLLAVWAIGASTLTWEHRKSTWLFLGLIIVNAALTTHRAEAAAVVQRARSVGGFVWQAK
jgi:O-antigen ligase